MAPFDAVLFNKEAPDIRQRIVKTNLRKTACFYDKKDLAAAANDYYQAYIENRAWQLGIPHLFDSRDNVKPTDPTEREQRAKGILRSWRNNLPVGLPVRGASFNGAAATVAASESEDVSGSATDVTEEATMGQIWATREDFQGHDLKLSSAVDGRAPSITRRQEKQHRFDAS